MRKGIAIAAVAMAAACVATTGCTPGFYSQDVGEVVVLKGMGGEVVGSTSEPGFHGSSPFDDAITYSTRNNVISLIGDGTEDYNGGSATGPKISCNDSSGTAFEVDVQLNYSLDPAYAEELYASYGTQEGHAQYVVAVDLRSVAREVAGRMTTMQMLTARGSFTGRRRKERIKVRHGHHHREVADRDECDAHAVAKQIPKTKDERCPADHLPVDEVEGKVNHVVQ